MKIRLYGTVNPVRKLTGHINAVPNPSLIPNKSRLLLVDSDGFILQDRTSAILMVRPHHRIKLRDSNNYHLKDVTGAILMVKENTYA